MPNNFDLLRYAATGIASPDMAYYDRMRASTLMGGTVKTLTGQPPLSFKSDGTPLISWSMKGDGSQQGTPTPDNPVMPEFVGVRTGNLLDWNRTQSSTFTTDTTKWFIGAASNNNANTGATVSVSGGNITVTSTTAGYGACFMIPAEPQTAYTISFDTNKVSSGSYFGYSCRNASGEVIFQSTISSKSAKLTTYANTAFIDLCFRLPPSDGEATFSNIMLNSGSTALPYEPFGYKIPLTCAGQIVPVYLGQTPTVRRIKKLVLDGTENINLYSVATGNLFRIELPALRMLGAFEGNGICTHYRPVSIAADRVNGTISGGNSAAVQSFVDIVDDYTTISDFKSYLAAQYANGTPVTVWYVLAEPETGIVNEPLAKIGDYADELSSTDAGVSIPTVKGQNTLTVDTDLQPSEVSITWHIQAST